MSTDWYQRALSVTKENMNDPVNNGFGIISNAQDVIAQFFYSNDGHIRGLHHILSLHPDLSLYGWKGYTLLGHFEKLKIVLSYGYTFPGLIEKAIIHGGIFLSDHPSIRLLFEHGTRCPSEHFRLRYPWLFEIHDQVQKRRASCACACVAILGVSRRMKSQRDVLSIVSKFVWESRTRDEWFE
jgi:hypothetical protein